MFTRKKIELEGRAWQHGPHVVDGKTLSLICIIWNPSWHARYRLIEEGYD